jgi:GDP-mannose 6-dehydrogenase
MKISVFGLGYVGCVSAGCLAEKGHQVIGVDVSRDKVDKINLGQSTIIEKGIGDLIRDAVDNKRLHATMNVREAVMDTAVSIISVGTPSTKSGHLNLDHVIRVCEQIGEILRDKETFHVIAIRSTVLPGTNRRMTEIMEHASGKIHDRDFAVVSNPEFLREGSAVQDYFNPPFTLLGTESAAAQAVMLELYMDIAGEKIFTGIEVAEIMKYVNNTFHALKVVFGNEVGNICKALGIDSHKVMDIFIRDTHLNISPYYLMPGFAYGGSCLPKDTRAFRTLAGDHYIDVPVISSIERSNEIHKDNAVQMILETKKRNIGILGLSFKEGTDDLRNSAIVDVVERLLGKGCRLLIFDRNVKLSELTGTNKDYIESKIPHLQSFIQNDIGKVVSESDVIVVANRESEFRDVLADSRFSGKTVIDLIRLWEQPAYPGSYEGICW